MMVIAGHLQCVIEDIILKPPHYLLWLDNPHVAALEFTAPMVRDI
jgi:hypothetical protein